MYFISFCLDLDLTAVTPPPSSPTVESEEPVHEVILEEEEEAEMEEFVCGEKEELDQQDAWEEETVNSVMETASQIQSKGKMEPKLVMLACHLNDQK